MRRTFALAVLLAACTAGVAPSTEPATTMAATTTTVDLISATEAWFGHLIDWVDDYHEEFDNVYQTHGSIFDLDEARLDCVEAQSLLPAWRDSIPGAPDPQLEALTTTLFDVVEDGLTSCANAETVGEHREAHATLAGIDIIVSRLSVRLNEIQNSS